MSSPSRYVDLISAISKLDVNLVKNNLHDDFNISEYVYSLDLINKLENDITNIRNIFDQKVKILGIIYRASPEQIYNDLNSVIAYGNRLDVTDFNYDNLSYRIIPANIVMKLPPLPTGSLPIYSNSIEGYKMFMYYIFSLYPHKLTYPHMYTSSSQIEDRITIFINFYNSVRANTFFSGQTCSVAFPILNEVSKSVSEQKFGVNFGTEKLLFGQLVRSNGSFVSSKSSSGTSPGAISSPTMINPQTSISTPPSIITSQGTSPIGQQYGYPYPPSVPPILPFGQETTPNMEEMSQWQLSPSVQPYFQSSTGTSPPRKRQNVL